MTWLWHEPWAWQGSLWPAVAAVDVGADVVEPHVGRRLLGVGLEEDSLSVPAPGTRVVIWPGHRGVLNHYHLKNMFLREYNETKGSHLDDICVNVGYLIDLVSNSVHINAARVGQLTKITVPGSKQFPSIPAGKQRPGQCD